MAKVSKAIVDKDLRDAVFTGILEGDEIFISKLTKINDRQMGVLLTGLDGEIHYIRLGAIVAELREDMTAEELMQSEIDAYEQKQADKAEKAKKTAEKRKQKQKENKE